MAGVAAAARAAAGAGVSGARATIAGTRSVGRRPPRPAVVRRRGPAQRERGAAPPRRLRGARERDGGRGSGRAGRGRGGGHGDGGGGALRAAAVEVSGRGGGEGSSDGDGCDDADADADADAGVDGVVAAAADAATDAARAQEKRSAAERAYRAVVCAASDVPDGGVVVLRASDGSEVLCVRAPSDMDVADLRLPNSLPSYDLEDTGADELHALAALASPASSLEQRRRRRAQKVRRNLLGAGEASGRTGPRSARASGAGRQSHGQVQGVLRTARDAASDSDEARGELRGGGSAGARRGGGAGARDRQPGQEAGAGEAAPGGGCDDDAGGARAPGPHPTDVVINGPYRSHDFSSLAPEHVPPKRRPFSVDDVVVVTGGPYSGCLGILTQVFALVGEDGDLKGSGLVELDMCGVNATVDVKLEWMRAAGQKSHTDMADGIGACDVKVPSR